ncbi:MAG: hypothetical protein QNL93_10260 [Opitutae bacterium]
MPSPQQNEWKDRVRQRAGKRLEFRRRNYAGAPRAWHGPFGLPPL